MHNYFILLSGIIIMIVSLTSGCTTLRAYEDEVRAWEGKNVDSLIAEWGKPARIEPLSDGGRTITYIKKHEEQLRVVSAEGGKVEYFTDCKTVFLADSTNTIVRWRYNGTKCVAPTHNNNQQ